MVGVRHVDMVGVQRVVGVRHVDVVGVRHVDVVGVRHVGMVGVRHVDVVGVRHVGMVGVRHVDVGRGVHVVAVRVVVRSGTLRGRCADVHGRDQRHRPARAQQRPAREFLLPLRRNGLVRGWR